MSTVPVICRSCGAKAPVKLSVLAQVGTEGDLRCKCGSTDLDLDDSMGAVASGDEDFELQREHVLGLHDRTPDPQCPDCRRWEGARRTSATTYVPRPGGHVVPMNEGDTLTMEDDRIRIRFTNDKFVPELRMPGFGHWMTTGRGFDIFAEAEDFANEVWADWAKEGSRRTAGDATKPFRPGGVVPYRFQPGDAVMLRHWSGSEGPATVVADPAPGTPNDAFVQIRSTDPENFPGEMWPVNRNDLRIAAPGGHRGWSYVASRRTAALEWTQREGPPRRDGHVRQWSVEVPAFPGAGENDAYYYADIYLWPDNGLTVSVNLASPSGAETEIEYFPVHNLDQGKAEAEAILRGLTSSGLGADELNTLGSRRLGSLGETFHVAELGEPDSGDCPKCGSGQYRPSLSYCPQCGYGSSNEKPEQKDARRLDPAKVAKVAEAVLATNPGLDRRMALRVAEATVKKAQGA